MKPFIKTYDEDNGLFHTVKYENGEQTIIIDIDNSNFTVDCELNNFVIHYQKIGSKISSSLNTVLNIDVFFLNKLDELIKELQTINEINKFIQNELLPSLTT